MKNVTQATENRIKKMLKDDPYNLTYEALEFILSEMKNNAGCCGCTIKELKDLDLEINNETQFKPCVKMYTPQFNGMTFNYPAYINYTDTLGMNTLTITDFNALVKAVAEGR